VDVVTIGDVMMDVRVEADLLEEGGDVHGRVLVRPGGSATNAAVWAAQTGARARVHGRIGGDTAGALIRDELMSRGVEPALVVDPALDTGSMLVVHEPSERSIVADRGANAALVPSDLPERIESVAVLVSGFTLLHEPTFAAATTALDRSSARYVAVDAGSWSMLRDLGPERFFDATARANVLLVNDREAEILTGRRGADPVDLLSQRYPVVCLKLGEAGATMSWEGLRIRYEGEPVDELDPTGAGDAFDGALLAALVAGAAPGDALRVACHAGASVAASYETWPERRGAPG
jgi:sugar/nucleoside kinase (ribokinase family)